MPFGMSVKSSLPIVFWVAKSKGAWSVATVLTTDRQATYPEPVEHCDVCRWAAEALRRELHAADVCLVTALSPVEAVSRKRTL